MKKCLVILLFVLIFILPSISQAFPFKIVAKKSQEINFENIGVYPQTIYQEDIKFLISKNGTGIICFYKFDYYRRQLPYIDYTAYNKWEQYEVIYDPFENLLIFRRTICNLSDELWYPGVRTKYATWYLIK